MGDGQTNDFGDFIGVIFEESFFEFLVDRSLGLDKEEDFPGRFLFAAPMVMGFKTGKDLDAGREPLEN